MIKSVVILTALAEYMPASLSFNRNIVYGSLYIGLGIVIALVGFNMMHDGGHGSFSQKPSVNTKWRIA